MTTNRQRRAAAAAAKDKRPIEQSWGCLLSMLTFGMMFLGLLAANAAVFGGGAILAGLLVLSRLAHDLQCGTTSSNWGTWRRDENPVGFRRNIGFWAAIAVLWLLFGLLFLAGLVRVPTYWFS